METLDYDLFEGSNKEYQEASKGKRLTNYLIDYLGYYIFMLAMGVLLGVFLAIIGQENLILYVDDGSWSRKTVDFITGLISLLIYYTSIEYFFKGKSLGKLITRTRAIQKNGDYITLEIAIKRSACRLIPFETFSYLGDLSSGWHDSIPNTKVIDEQLPIRIPKKISELNTNPALYDFLKKPEEE